MDTMWLGLQQRRLALTLVLVVVLYLTHLTVSGTYNYAKDEALNWNAATAIHEDRLRRISRGQKVFGAAPPPPPALGIQMIVWTILILANLFYYPIVIFVGTYIFVLVNSWWWPYHWALKCTSRDVEWFEKRFIRMGSSVANLFVSTIRVLVAVCRFIFNLVWRTACQTWPVLVGQLNKLKEGVGKLLHGAAAVVSLRWTLFVQNQYLVEAWQRWVIASLYIQHAASWALMIVLIALYASYMLSSPPVKEVEVPKVMSIQVTAKGVDRAHSIAIHRAVHLLTNTEPPYRGRQTPVDYEDWFAGSARIVVSTTTAIEAVTSTSTAWETTSVTVEVPVGETTAITETLFVAAAATTTTEAITVTPTASSPSKTYFKTDAVEEYRHLSEEEFEKARGPLVLREVSYSQDYNKDEAKYCSICKRKHKHETILAMKAYVFENEKPADRWWARKNST